MSTRNKKPLAYEDISQDPEEFNSDETGGATSLLDVLTVVKNLHKFFNMCATQDYNYFRIGKPYGNPAKSIRANTMYRTKEGTELETARTEVVQMLEVCSGYMLIAAYKQPYDSYTSTQQARESVPIRCLVMCPDAAKGYWLNKDASKSSFETQIEDLKRQNAQQQQHQTNGYQAPGTAIKTDPIDRILDVILPYAPAIVARLTTPAPMPTVVGQPPQQAPAPAPADLTPGQMVQVTPDTAKILELVQTWDNVDPNNDVLELIGGIVRMAQNNPVMYSTAVTMLKQS